MSTEENKAIVRRLFEEAGNKRNLALVDELLAFNYVGHTSYVEIKGAEGYKRIFADANAAFPDNQITIEDMLAEGDKVACRYTIWGTHTGGTFLGIAPTGKQFYQTGIVISRIMDGKIVEDWENIDMLTQLQQLGVIPPMGQ